MNKPVTISDLISLEEIKKWHIKDKVLVTSNTGTGKSYFILNILYSYCQINNKRILFYSNRTSLKNQIQNYMGKNNKSNSILVIRNYQQTEYLSVKDTSGRVETAFESFDYVVFDEAHRFITESSYDRASNIFLPFIRNGIKNAVLLCLTATPEPLLMVSNRNWIRYTIESNYDYINNLYFYKNKKSIEKVLKQIPDGQKAIYFGRIEDSLEFSKLFDDSAFLCSKGNKNKRFITDGVFDEIETNNRFNEKFLFSTSVINNGINLNMPELRIIIIDNVCSVEIIQMLGRRRINGDEKIDVYIRDYSGHQINGYLKSVEDGLSQIEEAEELGTEKFLKKNKRNRFSEAIFSDGKVNRARKLDLLYKKKLYTKFYTKLDDNGKPKNCFSSYIGGLLKQNTYKSIEEEVSFNIMQSILEKYIGIELVTKKDKKEFINIFFESLFKTNSREYRGMGIHTISAILLEKETGYSIASGKKRINGKLVTFWKVLRAVPENVQPL